MGRQKSVRWERMVCFIFLLSFFFIHTNTIAQSVLRQGTWVKIGVTESGIYRLSQAQLIKLNPAFSTADPRTLRLYGNGGAMLAQSNAVSRPADLLENAIQVMGESDGRFDPEDAILFFGQSPHGIRYDSVARRLSHQLNLYSDTTFYFLTIGSAPGLRIADRATGTLSASSTVTTFDDYQFHELDQLKLPSVRSGREWLGEYMTTDTTKTISFDATGAVANAPVRVTTSVVAGATVSTRFQFRLNNQLIGSTLIPSVSGYEYDYQAVEGHLDTLLAKLNTTANPIQLTVTFQKNGQYSAQGYLNSLGLLVRRELRQYDKPTWIRRLASGQYAVKQASSSLRIWDITNPLVPISQAYTISGQEAGWTSSQIRDYFLFTDTQFLTPVSLIAVANQDLHSQSTPDLIIVTPATWRTQAERLAQFRRDHDQLSVLVATTQQVYNEFGSGQSDPTAIRDMARYFYQKQSAKLRYLLLFGDATYDFRNIGGLVNVTQLANMVPTYESRESYHPVYSYSSDDYYGFMDANEGEWVETVQGDHLMDIGVGRLPVKSVDEAQTVVDKLIRYSSDAALTGDWQTRILFTADDGDDNEHQKHANILASMVETLYPAYRPERLFLGNYLQENTATGQKAPAMNQAINQDIADGRLIVNYSGHGGVAGLAEEQIVTLQDILSWKNSRLPLFVTATCQFGRYDDPNITSGAELTLLSRTGGGIGLLTTTRPVYSNTNLLLNQAFYSAAFTPIKGQMPRLGEIMRLTKNNSLAGPVNRNFTLLGDPSMQLAYPKAKAVLTQVNDKAVSSTRIDTLHALQTIDLTGEIRQQNQLLTNFIGTVQVSLYDKAVTQTTLGNESDSPKMSYQVFKNPIFIGQVPVQQGKFSVRFTIPKDIDYTVGWGKLYLYAVRTDSLFDAIGNYDSLRVGGSVFADSIDTTPPTVTLSVIGGRTEGDIVYVAGPDVTLRIDLADNRGINIARSGLGHELTAQLGSQTPVILNEYYIANGSNSRQGEVHYTFRDVLPGTYTIRVKAWDINNNSAEGTLTIVVSERPGLALRVFRASPNPLSDQTTLTAELNRSGEPLDWTVGIYDINSRLLHQQAGQCTNCDAIVNVGAWNGLMDNGQSVPNGLYIVRLDIRSAVDGTATFGTGRIVVTK